MKFAFIPKIFLITCTLLPVASYSQSNFRMAGSATPGVTAQVGSGPATGDPAAYEAVKKAIDSTLALRSYRVHVEGFLCKVGTDCGWAYRVDQDYVAPDRVRTVFDSRYMDEVTREESVRIGNDSFVHTDGTWKKGPEIKLGNDPQKIDVLVSDSYKDKILFENVGSNTVNDTPVTVYKVLYPSSTLAPVVSWVSIGTTDNLVHKFEMVVEMDIYESQTRKLAAKMKQRTIFTYSDFNADIKIEPPM